MPLGTDVGLVPDDIVLDGNPAIGQLPLFGEDHNFGSVNISQQSATVGPITLN